MFSIHPLRGDELPTKTLCLTFEDGPGQETVELGRCLARHHVSGTFFAMGAHLEEYPEAILRLLAQGHTVGNHTYSQEV